MKKVKKTFLTGLALFLPIAVAVFAITWSFQFFDSILEPISTEIFGTYWSGLGILTFIIFCFILGIFIRSFVGKKFVKFTEKIFNNIPLIRTIYRPLREIVSNVSSNKKKSFQQTVMVEFPQKGCKSLGFLSNDQLNVVGENKICVFIPTTPNPTNGYLVFLDKDDVIYLDMPPEEALKSIISMCTLLDTVK